MNALKDAVVPAALPLHMSQPAHSRSPEEERRPTVRRPPHLEESRHPLYTLHTESGTKPATFACLHRQEVIDEPSESGEEAVPLRRREAPNVTEERIRLFVGCIRGVD